MEITWETKVRGRVSQRGRVRMGRIAVEAVLAPHDQLQRWKGWQVRMKLMRHEAVFQRGPEVLERQTYDCASWQAGRAWARRQAQTWLAEYAEAGKERAA